MSLSRVARTPGSTLSLDYMENSPRDTRFLLPIPDAEPELEGRKCWADGTKDEFVIYLERSNN